MKPSQFQQKTLWAALTGIACVVLGVIIIGVIWMSGKVLAYLQPVLVPLAVAGIVAYLLEPVVVWLERHRKITRLRAVLIVLGSFMLVLATFGTFLTIKLGSQASELARNQQNLGTRFVDKLQSLQDKVGARPLVDYLTEYRDPETGDFINKPYPAREIRETDGKKSTIWVTSDGKPVEKIKVVDDAEVRDDAPESETGEETAPDEDAVVGQDPEVRDDAPDTSVDEPEKGAVAVKEIEIYNLTDEERAAYNDFKKQTKALNFSDQRIGILLTENWKTLTNTGLNWLKASTKVFGFIGYLLGFLLVPVYLFYFLNESAKIKASWTRYIPLKASELKDEVVTVLIEINSYLISFFRGQVLVSLIDGVLVGVALTIFGLPYGFLIGIALAFLGIIPFIGNILCMVPAAIIAFIHFGGSDANHHWLGDSPWAYVGAVIAIFIVVQQINSLVTAPKIVGDSVGLHPMTVIFSILFWSLLLGGFLGALLAVPLTAAIKVLFRRYLWDTRVSPNLSGNGPNPVNPTANPIP